MLSYALIFSVFLLLLAIALCTSLVAIELVNDTRSYATGEGRYSKAEKMAVLDLYRYAHSRDQRDYDSFLSAIAVPQGDRKARVALSRNPPDIEAAGRGFLLGQNHPSDVEGLIRLFQWFFWWQPFAAAEADWKAGDQLVDELISQATVLHQLVLANRLDAQQRQICLSRIDAIDALLTRRENTFTTHLGEAARSAKILVAWGLGATTILLWAIGIGFASKLMIQQITLAGQLASSERRFRDFAEVASDWYWETGPDNRITYVSIRFHQIANIEADAAIGSPGLDFIRDASEEGEHRDQCLLALSQRRPFRGLRIRLAPNGQNATYWSISGKPRVSETGEFLGYRGVGTDVTSQVSDAEQLLDAKNRAEVANRAKSEFLANMSHELRTPLNAIMGFAEIINSRMFGATAIDRYADYARDIHDSGFHLLSIINGVLDLAKVEAGHSPLHEKDVALDTIIDEVQTLLGDLPQRQGVAFHVVAPSPPPILRIDERKYIQIVINLLSNAFKFTPRNGSVTLTAIVHVDGGLAISIRDTGIGISPDDLETVLTPFGQVESVFSRNHHGTGLGLPLAKSLAELHGGTLVIESEKNEGTLVTVYLPASRVVSRGLFHASGHDARAIRA